MKEAGEFPSGEGPVSSSGARRNRGLWFPASWRGPARPDAPSQATVKASAVSLRSVPLRHPGRPSLTASHLQSRNHEPESHSWGVKMAGCGRVWRAVRRHRRQGNRTPLPATHGEGNSEPI
jgi:hypothetical protein